MDILCLIDGQEYVTYGRTARKMNFFESSKLAYGSNKLNFQNKLFFAVLGFFQSGYSLVRIYFRHRHKPLACGCGSVLVILLVCFFG